MQPALCTKNRRESGLNQGNAESVCRILAAPTIQRIPITNSFYNIFTGRSREIGKIE